MFVGRVPHILSRFLAAVAVVLAISPALAQDAGSDGLSDTLNKLLGGDESSKTEAPPHRRVPFGREEMQLSFAPLVKKTAPAVVNVYASQQLRQRSPFMGDPFFEQFFNRRMPPRVQSSLGSGVLVDPSGLVVTNHHVIRDADKVKVATSDGREFESKVLLRDESLDLAVLKIEADEPFPSLAIGNSDALEVGDLVLAIGNPFGVGQTTTSGIVSALARTHIGVSDFGFFIQTDAAINPGNSGGALINMRGELVGINTAIYSRSGGSIGIGFAIPSNIVKAVADAARNGSEIFERPYVGAAFEPVTAQIAEAVGLPRPFGALVASVEPDGPADRAKLRPGDVVLSMNGIDIEHVDALGYRLATQSIGADATFRVLSQGEEKSVVVRLEKTPADYASAPLAIDGESPFSGTKVAGISPTLARRLGLQAPGQGVAVVDVDPSSPAAGLGLRKNDVVLEVNGEAITSPETLKQVASQETRWWRFTIQRDGQLLRQMLRY